MFEQRTLHSPLRQINEMNSGIYSNGLGNRRPRQNVISYEHQIECVNEKDTFPSQIIKLSEFLLFYFLNSIYNLSLETFYTGFEVLQRRNLLYHCFQSAEK